MQENQDLQVGTTVIRLSGDLDFRDLALLSKRYVDVYNLLYWTSVLGPKPHPPQQMRESAPLNLPWTGRFDVQAFYDKLDNLVPKDHRPKINFIKYSVGSSGAPKISEVVIHKVNGESRL